MQLIKSKSFITTTLLALLIAVCFFKNPRQNNAYYKGEFQWDVFSYYMYLPYAFIYDDVKMRDPNIVHEIFKKYNIPGTYYQAYQLENGNWTPNYTMGFALLWSPFFFIGHSWAKAGGYPVDGWSVPYQFSVACGALLYILIGLFFLRKVLLTFFSENISTLVLGLLVLGTNYFHEAFNDYLQPHAMIFSGYAVLLYYTIRWHEEQKIKYVMIAGLVMGFMILSRPSEILCIIIPVLWNVYNKESLVKKIALVRSNYPHIIFFLIAAFLPFIPQIIYWKYVTDAWIFFSYRNTEGFDFLSPHVFKVLFSFKKSWLVYTPMILFPIIGVFLMRKYNRTIYLPILIFFLANFYLLSSWAAWWNGGSFGMRYFVDSYPVMAIPFGYVLADIGKRKWFIKGMLAILITFFVVLNLFQTWQYMVSIIPESRMTWAYYKKIFFKINVPDEDRKLMEVERYFGYNEEFKNPEEYTSSTIANYNFDSVNSDVDQKIKQDGNYCLSEPYSCRMTGEDEWGPHFKIQYDQLVPENKDHAWLRVTVNYFSEQDIKDNPASIVINMPHKKYNLKYRAIDFEKHPSQKGQWNKLVVDYMTPYPYSEKDHFDIYIWHRGKGDLYLDDFRIEAFLKKD